MAQNAVVVVGYDALELEAGGNLIQEEEGLFLFESTVKSIFAAYGSLTLTADANLTLTGQEFSTTLGTIEVSTEQIITLTGLGVFGLYTEPTIVGDANLTLNSLLITSNIDTANVWDNVVPSLSETIWTRIAA